MQSGLTPVVLVEYFLSLIRRRVSGVISWNSKYRLFNQILISPLRSSKTVAWVFIKALEGREKRKKRLLQAMVKSLDITLFSRKANTQFKSNSVGIGLWRSLGLTRGIANTQLYRGQIPFKETISL